MQHALPRLMLLLLTFALPRAAAAQCADNTQGTDFHLMFLRNYTPEYNPKELSLVAVGDSETVVYIYVNGSLLMAGPIGAAGPAGMRKFVMPTPQSLVYPNNGCVVQNRGLHVTATNNISLYAMNNLDYSYDGSIVLPTSALDTDYVVQTYPMWISGLGGTGSEVGFVATEDSTVLTMTLPCAIYNGNDVMVADSGTEHTITLQQGQTYQMHSGPHATFSGMRITSNGKPFACFQGTSCANVPFGEADPEVQPCGACDHLYEQTLPLKFWGKHFVVVPTAEHTGGDIALVTSSADSCVVTVDGTTVATLDAGGTKELEIGASTAQTIRTTQPATVGLYLKGEDCAGGPGDPAAVMLPPAEQGIQRVRFTAMSSTNTLFHYVNLVTRSVDTADMRLDGEPLDTTWNVLPTGYSWLQLPVTPGTHVLSNEHGRFVAFFYGLGPYESYAYIAGMGTHNLRNRLLVNEVDMLDYLDSIDICGNDTLRFTLVPEDSTTVFQWLLDGVPLPDTTRTVALSFPSGDWHRVDVALPAICDTLTAFVHSHFFHTDTTEAEICLGGSYTFDTLTFDSTGVYDVVYPDRYGCDSTRTLLLTVVDTTRQVTVDTICFDGSYTWRGRDYTEGGLYTDTVESDGGNCRTVHLLQLTQLQKPVDGIDSVSFCADGVYRLSVHPSDEAAPLPYSWNWSASPRDTLLDGHETDDSVIVRPNGTTLYILSVDYRCPYREYMALVPLKAVQAAMAVRPERMSDGMPWFDATDVSMVGESRTWFVDGVPVGTDYGLHYDVDAATDSVRLVLEVYAHGCRDTASRMLTVVHDGLWMPTVFAPQDADNGHFDITASRDVELVELTIYNRQGLQVFHTANPAAGWDGGSCPQGTYVWHLTFRSPLFPGVPQSRSGTVTLLR